MVQVENERKSERECKRMSDTIMVFKCSVPFATCVSIFFVLYDTHSALS